MKVFAAVIFATPMAWAASYVPWDKTYELWMPTISSHRAQVSLVVAAANTQSPFGEPKISFAPSPMFQKAPFSASEAMAFGQNYFAASSPMIEMPKVVLMIEKSEILLALSSNNFPTELTVFKDVNETVIVAAWAKDLPADDREKIEAAAREAVKNLPEGRYQATIGVKVKA